MELTNEFTVHLPPDQAWDVLTDLPRMAPFVPGARLLDVEGMRVKGEMKVRVGPLTTVYKGEVRLVERDRRARRAVLRADGHDARQGSARATITATLHPAVTGTRVLLATDLSVAGKVADFGRSVLADISVKLAGQFAERLGAELRPEPSATPFAAAAMPVVPVTGDAVAPVVAEDWDPPPPGATAVPWPAPVSAVTAPVCAVAPPVPDVTAPAAEGPAVGAEAATVQGPAAVPATKRLAPVAVGAAVLALLIVRRLRR